MQCFSNNYNRKCHDFTDLNLNLEMAFKVIKNVKELSYERNIYK